MTTFTYTDAELDFGTHSLGGDWTLTIRSDDGGRTFKLVDAETCLKGVSRTCFALIQEWIEDDAAKAGKSLVRKAYDEAQPDDGQSYVYTAPVDHRSIWSRA
jgi:hypothetical protein